MGGAIKAPTNTPRPYHKKKRAVHQAASDFGIIISHSPLETSFAAPRACCLNKHKHNEHVTRLITLLQNWPSEMGLVTRPALLVDHYYDDCWICRKRRSGGGGAGVDRGCVQRDAQAY